MEQDISDDSGIDLTAADIQEFIEIYKQEFKEDLSVADARAMASGVLELYLVLSQPLPSEKKDSGNQEFTSPFLES